MLRIELTLIWLALSVFLQSLALNDSDTDKLFADKFWKNNPYRRPVWNQSDTVNVSVAFDVRVLVSFDESTQVFGCVGWFSVVWTDPELAWNSSSYGGLTEVTPPPANVWKPPMYLTDMVVGPTPLGETFMSLKLTSFGKITWTMPTVIHAGCGSNMVKYPYERLVCRSHLGLWTYNKNEVVLFASNISLENVVPSKQWSISNPMMIATEVAIFENRYSTILISFSVIGITYSFTFTFILPVVNLAVMATFVFLIPATSGEKLSYAITISLSHGVYMGFLITMTPINSGLSAFTIFLTICVILSSVYTILSIISVNLSTWIDDLYPVSERLAKCVIFLEKLLKIKGLSSRTHLCDNRISPTPSDTRGGHVSQVKGDPASRVTWQRVSRTLDKTCFVFFITLITLVVLGLVSITFTK